MKNFEKYKDFVSESFKPCKLKKGLLKEGVKIVACKDVSCTECKERCLKWLLEEYSEPILDEVEKAYLSAVIKPFRKKINYIEKVEIVDNCVEYLKFGLYGEVDVSLPNFKANTMYKGMEPYKRYKLEELGL